jgi:hypothetical protein
MLSDIVCNAEPSTHANSVFALRLTPSLPVSLSFLRVLRVLRGSRYLRLRLSERLFDVPENIVDVLDAD